jgi:hypothetical protein
LEVPAADVSTWNLFLIMSLIDVTR